MKFSAVIGLIFLLFAALAATYVGGIVGLWAVCASAYSMWLMLS